MKRYSYRALVVFILLYSVFRVSAQQKITVAVAANMQYTIEALKALYNKSDRTEINIVLGASGNLTQQIMVGAPFDIFISADTSLPQKLFSGGFTAGPPKGYARGLLVLWSAKQNIHPRSDLRLLLSDSIKTIAIANPETAPYGAAAGFILKKYGLYDKIMSKLVTGESITQTTQFIATRAADIGFTAKSIVISDQMKGRGEWVELNRDDYQPIKQSAVLLKYGQQHHAVAAKKFYEFLFCDQAKALYKKFGYIVN